MIVVGEENSGICSDMNSSDIRVGSREIGHDGIDGRGEKRVE